MGSFANRAGARDYKLYVPSGYRGQELPLIVMLHGCTQTPDDFASGTRMNAVAELKPCFVLYPAQAQHANGSRCWNWFKGGHQKRDRGEPSIIADMTRELVGKYRIDCRRVYVAGLSSGGAMAVVMKTTYPDLYAAVGVHSGLAYGAAHDLASALEAMQGRRRRAMAAGAHHDVSPVIVFHGDGDKTVHPRNADEVLAQGLPSVGASASAPRRECSADGCLTAIRSHGRCTRTTRGASSQSTGSSTGAPTRGRAEVARVRMSTRTVRMRRARCCAFSHCGRSQRRSGATDTPC